MPDDHEELADRPWRCGRKVGRTVYAQVGDKPSGDDVLIGVMDTPLLAGRLVVDHNKQLTDDGVGP